MNSLVSVILPVYNSSNYLHHAIKSIIDQKYQELEIIIINDGSTDNSDQIIKQYTENDPRIVYIKRENKGLVFSLNEGIRIARGKYIARMDSDDLSHPNRIKEQVAYLEKYELDLCGTAIIRFNGWRKKRISYPKHNEEIKLKLLFGSPFAHPSILGKSALFKQNLYEIKYKHAEDFDLWQRLAANGIKSGNLSESLLLYREHQNQISALQNSIQKELSIEIAARTWQHYFKETIDSDDLHSLLRARYAINHTPTEFLKTINILNLLLKINVPNYNCISQDIFMIHLNFSQFGKEVYENYIKLSKSLKLKSPKYFSILLYLYCTTRFRFTYKLRH